MDVWRYIMDLLTVIPADPNGPWKIFPYRYDMRIDHVVATLISRKMDDPGRALLCTFAPLTVTTDSEPRIINVRSSKLDVTTQNYQPVMHLEGLDVAVEFEMLNPDVLSPADQDSGYMCIHKFLTHYTVDLLRWTYFRRTITFFLEAFQSFFGQELPDVDPTNPFVVQSEYLFFSVGRVWISLRRCHEDGFVS
jgi:hypothetical protein